LLSKGGSFGKYAKEEIHVFEMAVTEGGLRGVKAVVYG
jgi:hypothetical protein